MHPQCGGVIVAPVIFAVIKAVAHLMRLSRVDCAGMRAAAISGRLTRPWPRQPPAAPAVARSQTRSNRLLGAAGSHRPATPAYLTAAAQLQVQQTAQKLRSHPELTSVSGSLVIRPAAVDQCSLSMVSRDTTASCSCSMCICLCCCENRTAIHCRR